MNIIEQKWDVILDTIKNEYDVGPASFNTFFLPLQFRDYDDQKKVLYIYVSDKIDNSSDLFLNLVDKKCTLFLKLAIEEITGIQCSITYTTEKAQEDPQTFDTPDDSFDDLLKEANLNPEYTFENFVVGSNNKFAQAASVAVAESPGNTYNPLFLYGGVGLGKTHLMHSIAHLILENDPKMRVLYVTSETFTNELIEAIRNGNNTSMTTKFREKYRNIDVLLIDDIQFVIGKESTQEEFFHTFNYLHGLNKQIIITSDKPPKDFPTLEERLRSRFEWGLIADISPPDYETRMAILRKKEEKESKEKGYHLNEEVIQYIATNITSNIRELEGALNRITAMSSLENREIDLDLAKEALKDMIFPNEKRTITPELIITTVAEHFDLKVEDIKGSKRSADIVVPRQIAMYLCRYMTNTPLKSIGKIMGNRDHTTVLHGVEKISKEIDTSEDIQNMVTVIKQKLDPS